jgi:hypothetical protein
VLLKPLSPILIMAMMIIFVLCRSSPHMAPLLAGYVCMRCSLPLATLVRRDPAVVSEPVAVLLVKESAEASEQFLGEFLVPPLRQWHVLVVGFGLVDFN